MRVGFIHITNRPDSWGHYYKWELRRGHPEIQLIEMAEEIGYRKHRWSKTRCNAYLRIDDSGGYATPEWMRPTVLLLTDTHVPDGVDRQQMADGVRDADGYVFVAQKNAVGSIGDEWLPHSAYYFPDRPSKPSLDVASCMVLSDRNALFAERTALALRIRERFAKTDVCWGPIHDRMADLYANARIGWNCSVGGDVNMRCFEVAAAGACLVTDQIDDNGFDEIFDDLAVTYRGVDDMLGKIDHLLSHPDECRERGEALCNVVGERYTYAHAARRVVEKLREIAE